MNNKAGIFFILALGSGTPAFADDLLPATSEDAALFDQQLAQQPGNNSRKNNFGRLVSDEATNLKAENQKGHLGTVVSGQRRNDAGSSASSGMGGGDGGGLSGGMGDTPTAALSGP